MRARLRTSRSSAARAAAVVVLEDAKELLGRVGDRVRLLGLEPSAVVDPARTAYVGDSPFDIRAAKAAGMFAVAVTWGRIHGRSRLEAEEPDAIVDTAEELLAVLA